MTPEQVQKRVIEIVSVTSGISEASITRESRFDSDVPLDSIDRVELVMGLEDEYGIAIPDDVAESWQTVGQAIDYLVSRGEVK